MNRLLKTVIFCLFLIFYTSTAAATVSISSDNGSIPDLIDLYYGAARIASVVDGYGCDASYCIYQPWYAPGQIYAKNGSTGRVEYSGTDFYTVITSALNSLSSGGNVRITQGDFFTTACIKPASYTTISGSGMYSTKIHLNSSANTSVFCFYDSVGSRLENMFVDGNKDQNPSGGYGVVINQTSATDSFTSLDNIIIKDSNNHNLYIHTTKEVQINNVFVQNGNADGAYITGSDHKINALVAGNNSHHGIRIQGSTIQITNSKAFTSGGTSTGYYNLYSSAGTGNIFTNFVSQGGSHHGIVFSGTAADISFQGMSLNDGVYNSGAGMRLDGIENVTIYGGLFRGSVQGINIKDSVNVVITGNSIYGISYSVYSEGTSGNNIIYGNDLVGTFVLANSIAYNNLKKSPFYHGNRASAPTPFGKGDTYFNTVTNRPCYYSGTAWLKYSDNTPGC